MHDSSHTANQLYTGDAATYGNTHAPATYRQAGCQDVSYSIDCQIYTCRFSWTIKYQVFNPWTVGRQTRYQVVTLSMSANLIQFFNIDACSNSIGLHPPAKARGF